jgi:hypothetical protein
VAGSYGLTWVGLYAFSSQSKNSRIGPKNRTNINFPYLWVIGAYIFIYFIFVLFILGICFAGLYTGEWIGCIEVRMPVL